LGVPNLQIIGVSHPKEIKKQRAWTGWFNSDYANFLNNTVKPHASNRAGAATLSAGI